MKTPAAYIKIGMILLFILLLTAACGNNAGAGFQQKLPTSTPTEPAADKPPTTAPEPSPCEGLAGTLEVLILVGPAEVVGLEPYSVGSIPWSVTSDESPYFLQGQGPISYQATLTEEWGTYTVTLDLDLAVLGECGSAENVLNMSVEMTGDQLVEVTADGFHGEYPWSGTQLVDIEAPIEEGFIVVGEGYTFVLHIQ